MQTVHMPRFVDSQPQFFFWEMDEFIVYILVLGGGIALRELVAFSIAGFVIVKLFGIWKARRLDGALLHLGYRNIGMSLNKIFSNGSLTEYIE
ncbi:type IV conjugative transfer system protein TraL [Acidithiobacillus sp. MC6.1]|nr:type IV conjugative transfer system protein TraL [Acidithiobacillus sp. MC6.1]